MQVSLVPLAALDLLDLLVWWEHQVQQADKVSQETRDRVVNLDLSVLLAHVEQQEIRASRDHVALQVQTMVFSCRLMPELRL